MYSPFSGLFSVKNGWFLCMSSFLLLTCLCMAIFSIERDLLPHIYYFIPLMFPTPRPFSIKKILCKHSFLFFTYLQLAQFSKERGFYLQSSQVLLFTCPSLAAFPNMKGFLSTRHLLLLLSCLSSALFSIKETHCPIKAVFYSDWPFSGIIIY